MIIVKGGLTTPKGFLANGVKAGLKKSGRLDLALLYSEVPAVAAGAFTTNRFQASPVKINKLHIKNKTHQAVIVNSGNANCANGRPGDKDAMLMAKITGKALGLENKEILVASTGIIGRRLPIDKINDALPVLVHGLSVENGGLFAQAIMTTDTYKKELACKIRMGKSVVSIGASCKGVGMIYPNMAVARHATLLAFITTDASISKSMLESALSEAVDGSFNMVSVDGDMSTNDMCIVMANGLAGNARIAKKNASFEKFKTALGYVTKELAKMLARDGEGATKFVEIEVVGAKDKADAAMIARKISTSNLLKCCIFGEDPNWGRIVAAAGSSGVNFDPNKVDVFLGDVKVFSKGASRPSFDKQKVRRLFKEKDIHIKVYLNSGSIRATAWTCDLSKAYVEINSEYST